jgi:hypothetical protein
MSKLYRSRALGATLFLLSVPLVHCSSASSPGSDADGGECYPDNDGVNDMAQNVELTVDDKEFSRIAITTQNASPITFTLKNKGTKPHGFVVESTSVLPGYPNLPAGCATTASFPPDSTITALAPGKSKTITFMTPTPDNITFPFKSNEADDSKLPGLNGSDKNGWTLM